MRQIKRLRASAPRVVWEEGSPARSCMLLGVFAQVEQFLADIALPTDVRPSQRP